MINAEAQAKLLELGDPVEFQSWLAEQPLETIIRFAGSRAAEMFAAIVAYRTAYDYFDGHIHLRDDSPLMQACDAFMKDWRRF